LADFDVFNGDADGICALVQLRRATPRTTKLVTGVKRDIKLLSRIDTWPGDHLMVLDISMRTNIDDLKRILKTGATVHYIDHHVVSETPTNSNLRANIQTKPEKCTAIIVNETLDGAYLEWACMAAFGDNLVEIAYETIKPLGLDEAQVELLKEFGQLVNYNAYGHTISDLHYAPGDLFRRFVRYDTPSEFLAANMDVYETLKAGYQDDMAKAKASLEVEPHIYILEDAPWARRIYGSFINELALETPGKPHAVITHNAQGGYMVSVRAPRADPDPQAYFLCVKFPTGGGRHPAAGINNLHPARFDSFVYAFENIFKEFLKT